MRTDFQLACDPPLARLTINGELDLTTSARLADVLAGIDRLGCRLLELDLAGVTFVDAHSLGLLDEEQRRLVEAGGDLVVVAASPCHVLVSRLAGYPNLHPVAGIRPRLTLLRPEEVLSTDA